MVHPATQRAVRTAIAALGVPLDVGFVFAPKPGEQRGYGQWTNRDLSVSEIMAMLPRAAAANARNGNVYMRLGPWVKDSHPGIVMIDDLSAAAVDRLSRDGFEPRLVVETSPGNFQAWIGVIESGSIPYAIAAVAVRYLAHAYNGDEKAVSPRQPGRLPGFTNRKPRHQREDGRYPFVRLISAKPGRVARNGIALLEKLTSVGTAGAARRGAPETPRIAADAMTETSLEITACLDAINKKQSARIEREAAEGRRPLSAASHSEIDFAVTKVALEEGITPDDIAAWLSRARPEKDPSYPERTVSAAMQHREGRPRPIL